ncbi:PREDICTED: uncharacterized protein LOC105365107 [Ceratosolen solmsi marchali]|uniref:Uncharacterized protein LOC105365107 n=1 Tax=Ceratosolen solmsi marchali TaxID=326594 RepID=A0AAJ6YNV8_9HYME|nr:PREDICTED: uncharacterized protein LOC105365107 [Ceratosolen solmsi marchali]
MVNRIGNTLYGNNTARCCLQNLLKKFSRNGDHHHQHQQLMKEYEDLNHITKTSMSKHEIQYNPLHHSLLKPDSITIKLRVVFDGSSTSISGLSINDIMHSEPNLNPEISDILIWIRRQRHLYATDITKMYRQIKIHKDDWDLQRILWIDEQQAEVSYHLTTVT